MSTEIYNKQSQLCTFTLDELIEIYNEKQLRSCTLDELVTLYLVVDEKKYAHANASSAQHSKGNVNASSAQHSKGNVNASRMRDIGGVNKCTPL
jgi:hypothetical protein